MPLTEMEPEHQEVLKKELQAYGLLQEKTILQGSRRKERKMVRVIMHGCNGVMGQVITGMAKDMEGLTIVAGIDLKNDKENGYPVYASLEECKEEADVVVDFASPKAADHLMDFCAEKKLGLVLCTTGLSEEQIKKVKETAEKNSSTAFCQYVFKA